MDKNYGGGQGSQRALEPVNTNKKKNCSDIIIIIIIIIISSSSSISIMLLISRSIDLWMICLFEW